MVSQDDIKSALFTANLGSWRDASDPDKGVSFYTFGYIDQDVLTAANVTEPYYTPVDNSQGFWMFDSASATVNGKSIARTGNTAIADTGTTLALIDDTTCKAIYDAIPGSSFDSTQQGYIFPSSVTADQLPVVTVAVGDQQFTINKEDLAFADAGNGNVYGGIQSRGDMTFDILGDTFLKSIYAVSPFIRINSTVHVFFTNTHSTISDLRPRQHPLRRCPAHRAGTEPRASSILFLSDRIEISRRRESGWTVYIYKHGKRETRHAYA